MVPMDRICAALSILAELPGRSSARLDVSRMTISRWSRGLRTPDPDSVRKLAVALHSEFDRPEGPVLSPAQAIAWLEGGSHPALDRAEAALREKNVGRLRCIRAVYGLSQAEAAVKAGVSRATWIAWEQASAAETLKEGKFLRAVSAISGNVSGADAK